ncbi:hypothetical protein GCM10011415_12590 [Salipiger pallidus]|uniref:Uncharacterized protein n=1 Tax=Salipiger pallidus TaxID=1775170 RepID=A0A8J2ZIJ0_9RHOB|nr:hypothetical protein [Salipiger pallidus]GGG67158.1 hypothetical protein GCM10011415_12590 [Salipiger pallidus]
MGYSPPKKQLDLKDFLSKPAKKRSGAKGFGYRKFPTNPVKPATEADFKTPDPKTD